jgi:zona occludens toxin
MSVSLVTGVPGAGKSHETVRFFLVKAFETGRKVVTNIGLNIEEIEKQYPKMKGLIEIKRGTSESGDPMEIYSTSFNSAEDYKDEWRNEKGQAALYVIDEAHFVFGTDNCSKDKIIKMTNFITTHRKLGIDIVVITQVSDMLNRTILKLMESCYSCEKLDYMGLKNSYRVNFLRKYNDRKAESVETHKYSKQIHSLYSSHEGNIIEEAEMRKPSFTKLLKMFWFVPLFLILVTFVVYWVYFKNVSEKTLIPSINPLTEINKTVTTKPKIKKKKKIDSVKNKVPLWDKEIFVQSWYSNTSLNGVFTFIVKDKEEYLFNITSRELEKVGYSIITFEDNYCLVILKYKSYSRFSYCIKDEEENTDTRLFDSVG